jgi:hypothetical protein
VLCLICKLVSGLASLQQSHYRSYWLGSQATGQPIYQYRIIFADDDKFLNMSTDADINVEGEVKWPLVQNVLGKLNFTVRFALLLSLTLPSSSQTKPRSPQQRFTTMDRASQVIFRWGDNPAGWPLVPMSKRSPLLSSWAVRFDSF